MTLSSCFRNPSKRGGAEVAEEIAKICRNHFAFLSATSAPPRFDSSNVVSRMDLYQTGAFQIRRTASSRNRAEEITASRSVSRISSREISSGRM